MQRRSALPLCSSKTRSRVRTDLATFTAAARGERARQQRLSGTRRTVEEHTAGRRNFEAFKHFRVQERQGDHLLELLDVRAETADRIERDIRRDAKRISVGES